MPFTFSHPAAVLPLRRSGLVFSALVIGSMAPDFEFFLRLSRPLSHSFPGVITFTFPAALALLVVFHSVAKWPLISLLPHEMQARLAGPARRFRWRPASHFLAILASLAVGIASHLVWDAFTHEYGWGVMRWALLQMVVFKVDGRSVMAYELLQLGSTVAGAGILAIWLFRWYRHAQPERGFRAQFSAPSRVVMSSALILTAIAAALFRPAHGEKLFSWTFSHPLSCLTALTFSTTTVGALALLAYSIVWQAFFRGADLRAGVRVDLHS